MITSWILNSISKELVEAFTFTPSVSDLWLELAKRYDKSNSLLIYQLQRKINSISQEYISVLVYFTKLKVFWQELGSIEILPPCIHAMIEKINEILLIGLNDSFDPIKDRVLMHLPLPSMNKAYSMVLKFESQRQVLRVVPTINESLVLFNKAQTSFQSIAC